MEKFFERVYAVIAWPLKIAVMVTMGLLVLDVLWQVFTRYVPLLNPSSWTDELATMLLVWVALLGASVAFIEKSHLGVDYFVEKLPKAPRTALELLVYVLIGAFAWMIMIDGGWNLVSMTLVTKQTSAALGVKMGYVYLVVPISGFFILLFAFVAIIEKLCHVFFGEDASPPLERIERARGEIEVAKQSDL